MKKLGLVAIRTNREVLGSLKADLFYAAIGSNTGNLLFTRAVQKQIVGETEHLGFAFDPQRVNADFDALVIPAANWISGGHDWGHLADLIERVNIPCIMIGLGAQASLGGSVGTVPDGTLRFLRAVSERAALISVRGAASAEILATFGIRNVCVTGCPSLYWSCQEDFEVNESTTEMGTEVAIHSTRFGAPRGAVSPHDDIHRKLYQYALESDSEIVYQSEVPELLISFFGPDAVFGPEAASPSSDVGDPIKGSLTKQAQDSLVGYYGAPSWTEFLGFISRRGLAFVEVDDWIARMAAQDFVIGTRLHGTIAALLAGTPAMLIAHDLRTAEVAEFAGIPQASAEKIATLDRSTLELLYATLDLSTFNRKYRQNYITYRDFLEENGLAHNLR